MERIQLLHPEGKKAPTMELAKYDTLKTSLFACLKTKKVANFQELVADVDIDLLSRKIKFQGKLEWNLFWVMLDLESKQELYRDKNVSPMQYSLPKKSKA